MVTENTTLFPSLTKDVVKDIHGFKLCAYLIALEGWRRGLTLKWYKDETDQCKLARLNSSTHGIFFSLSSSEKTHYFFRSRGDKVSNEAVRICREKEETKQYLLKAKVPTTEGKVFQLEDEKEIKKYAAKLRFPVIIKPTTGSMGRGVYKIERKEHIDEVLENLRTTYKYKEYIVEKYYPGKEYRVYVVGDEVIGATNRLPANVTGDGKSTVEELIKNKNNERKKNPYLAPKPIKVDFEVKKSLKDLGYNLKSVPKKGEQVFLRQKSNLSSGGDPIEATDELSRKVRKIAVDALKALPSMPHGGVDVIVDPKSNNKAVVLEINATAEIGFHSFPLEGNAKDVPGAVIDYYFPETAGKRKSSFYFDYNKILEPLKAWAAEEIKVPHPPIGHLYAKKYTVTGKINKVGYMSWMRRQALKRNVSGYAKKIDVNHIEIVVIDTDEQKLEPFLDLCYKGSKKAKVSNVDMVNLKVDQDTPFKLGFDIIV